MEIIFDDEEFVFRHQSLQQKIDYEIIADFSEDYIDNDFKPVLSSLLNFESSSKLTQEKKEKWASYEWKKIKQIYSDKLTLLENPSCNDVIQGYIGNCYLLSVCAAVAEYPQRLKKIFLLKKINKAGIFALEFIIDGRPKRIIVDEYIPYSSSSKSPPFSCLPKSRNIWMIVIEKAWAKYLQSYHNTIAGYPNYVFTILTGAPSSSILVKNYKKSESQKNILWEMLSNGFLNNYYVCCATHSKDVNDSDIKDLTNDEDRKDYIEVIEEMTKMNFVFNHAYSVLVSYEFEASGLKTRLVKIRNPWGKTDREKLIGEKFLKSYQNNTDIEKNIGKIDDGNLVLTYDEFLRYCLIILLKN